MQRNTPHIPNSVPFTPLRGFGPNSLRNCEQQPLCPTDLSVAAPPVESQVAVFVFPRAVLGSSSPSMCLPLCSVSLAHSVSVPLLGGVLLPFGLCFPVFIYLFIFVFLYYLVSLFLSMLVLGSGLGHSPLKSVFLFVLAVLPPFPSAFLSLWLWVLGYLSPFVCVPSCCVCWRWVVVWVSISCGLSFYLSLLSFFFVLSARQKHRETEQQGQSGRQTTRENDPNHTQR